MVSNSASKLFLNFVKFWFLKTKSNRSPYFCTILVELDIDETENDGVTTKPATSCHLRYGPNLPDYSPEANQSWKLEATVQVERSADHTYFMVVGFYPGGYCGIQQKENNERVAIFSLWNKGSYSVESVGAGPGVQVSEFGGEGTGIKTMRDCDWKEETSVTFSVEGYIEGMISYSYVFKH